MTARQRVIAALGGRCAWCQSTAGPFEIDHIHGGGNQHRAQIRVPLERWLAREYHRTGVWPVGYHLLCVRCHDAKSGRRPTMPARQGNTSINVSLPDDLVARLDVLARKPGVTRSQVVADAIRDLLEGRASQTLLEGLHARLDHYGATLTAQEQALKALTLRLQEMQQSVEALGKRYRHVEAEAHAASDRQTGYIPYTPHPPNGQTPKGWARIFRRLTE
jgi:predicted transcriptional regulator